MDKEVINCTFNIFSWISYTGWIPLFVIIFIAIPNYVVYKYMANAKSVRFRFLFKPVFCLVTSLFAIFSVPLFMVYKHIIHWILKAYYGSKYGGILDGRDSIYNLENANPAYILFIIRYNPKTNKSFYEHCRDIGYNELVEKGKHHSKIFGAIKKFMGYTFILKNEISFDDCVKRMQTVDTSKNKITKDDVLKIMEDYSEVPLPKDREAFWEVFIGAQPILWTNNDNDSLELYPVLLRMNHTFADARHLVLGIVRLFGDSKDITLGGKTINVETMYDTASKNVNFIKRLGFNVIFYLKFFFSTSVIPSVSFVNSLMTSCDFNDLHGPKLRHNKHFFLNSDEDKLHSYVGIIKRIKNKIPRCTFADVVFTAMAASFRDYFIKNSTSLPEYIVAETPVPAPFDLSDIDPPENRIHCRNRLSFTMRKLPINVDFEHTTTPMLHLLELIRKEGAYVECSWESEVNYWVIKLICGTFPSFLLKPLIYMIHNYTALISNVPGPDGVWLLDECKVEDVACWVATRGNTGIGFVIFSYDCRLQLSLTVDKAITAKKEKMRFLFNRVYKYLDMLDSETRNM